MQEILWIVIGLAAALVITALAPDMGPPRTSRLARPGRNVVAGVVGALVGASTHIWFDRASSGGLTTALAGLAGALWLAGIVEVFSSRRRRGEATVPPDSMARPSSDDPEVTAYDAARHAVVAGLIEDARAHEAGRYAEIGRQFPAVRDRVSRQDPAWNFRLQLALRFWRGWTLARDERWRRGDDDTPMSAADWPRFARTIASDLSVDRDTTDPAIIGRFAYATPWRIGGATSLAGGR
jgi:hypothetical protein